MKTPNLSKLINQGWRVVKRNSPQILLTLGIGGMFTTTVLVATATPKALQKIEEKREEVNDELRPIEKVEAAWKCYIPAATTFALSAACLIGAQSVNVRRNAALAAAYALSESALKEYQDKVVETFGEKKDQMVRDAIAKDKVEKIDTRTSEIFFTDKGDTLCLDPLSKRLFKSDIEKLKRAENELNRRMRDEMYISLNEFYREIDLDEIDIGDMIGWNIDRGYIELAFSAQLTKDGVPCMVVGHHILPDHDYNR